MVEITNNCGTCKGITKALALVYDVYEKELLKSNPKNIYVYGKFINNTKVINELKEIGIEIIDDISITNENDIVIIGTFGCEQRVKDYLEKYKIEYYDGTCANILKTCNTVFEKYSNGYEIVIIGNPKNLEVATINTYCNNKAIIIESDVDFSKLSSNKQKYIICNSFVSKNTYEEIKMKLKTLYDNYDLEFGGFYCNAISKMKDEVKSVNEKYDVLFVVDSDEDRNNLFDEINANNVYHFNNLKDFQSFILEENISAKNKICLIGDNSTPIKEVYQYKELLEFLLFYKEVNNKMILNENPINIELDEDNNIDVLKSTINSLIDLNDNDNNFEALLIALGENACDSKKPNYCNLAQAYKMIQTSSQIHLDIFDNQKMRDDKETIPRRICHKYLNEINDKEYQNDVLRVANTIGISAGNLGFNKAINFVAKKYNKNDNFKNIIDLLDDIMIKSNKGKMTETWLSFYNKYEDVKVEEQDILNMYDLEYSWPKFIGPFILGILCGGQKRLKKYEKLFSKIGLYAKLQEDINDDEWDKLTLSYAHVLNTSYEKEFLKQFNSQNKEDFDTSRLKDILDESGSINYVNNLIDNLKYEIIQDIESIDFNDDTKELLKGLIIYLNNKGKRNE